MKYKNKFNVEEEIARLEARRELLLRWHQLRREVRQLESSRRTREGVGVLAVRHVVEAVAVAHRLSVPELLGRRRTAQIARARFMAWYCLRRLTAMTLDQIGIEFSRRDHTTVAFGIESLSNDMECHPDVKVEVEKILALCRATLENAGIITARLPKPEVPA